MLQGFVKNIFLKALFITNSSHLSTDLLTGHVSVPYSKLGKHLVVSNSTMTSSDALQPTCKNTALNDL